MQVKRCFVGKPAPVIFRPVNLGSMDKPPSRLRDLRDSLKISQADAAAHAGISRSHLSKIEHGADPMSFEVALRLSLLYRVSIAELLPPEHDMRGVEVVMDREEKGILAAIRKMPDDEKRTILKLLTGRASV